MVLKKDHLLLFGVVFYIFAASTFFDGSLAIQISRLVIVGIYALVLLSSHTLKLNSYTKWLLLFAAFSLFSCVYALSVPIAVSGASTTIISSITILSFIGLCSEIENHDVKLTLLKCFSIIPLALGLYIFTKHGIFCFANSRYIVSEHFFNSNTLGLHSAIGFVLSFWLLSQDKVKKKFRWIYCAAAALNGSFVILTASRKSIIVIVLSLVFFYLFQAKSPTRFIVKILIAIAVSVIIFLALVKIPFLYELGGKRLEQLMNAFMSEDETDGSTSFRIMLIEWGIDWFKRKPLFGYGADNYRVLVGRMNTWAGVGGTYAHNNFIELLVDLGLVGFAVYYSMYIHILKKFILSIKYNKDLLKLIIGCVFLALFISETGIVSYADKYIQVVYASIWFIIFSDKGVNTVDRKPLSECNCAVI